MDYVEVNFQVKPRDPGADILCASLCDHGYDSFVDTEEGVTAYIPFEMFSEDELGEVISNYSENFNIDYQFKKIEGQNWNSEWEKNFTPVVINDQCVIRAPFHDPYPDHIYEIIIEPKMSFGTGHHETTTLMADTMLDESFDGIAGKSVLDMGCGTGILAILADKMKASEVTAIDIDDWAFSNTCENILVNNCKSIKAEQGDAKRLQGRKFDTILANINRNILLNDLPVYAGALNAGGNLLLSGFFDSDVEVLKNKADSLGLSLKNQKSLHKWTLLHFEK